RSTYEASNKTDHKSAAERVEGRRPVEGKGSSDARPGLRAGPGVSLKRRAYGLEGCGLPSSYPRSRLTFDESPLRESRTVGSRAARLAAIPAGASPANTRSPVHVVVISSGSEGDQTAGSLEVRAPWGRGDLVRSVKGGRATWQAVA